jgi:hypothetical protein
MTIYDLPASSNWSKLLREYNLINLFCKMLVPGMAQNDLLLEIVMLISTVAADLQVRVVGLFSSFFFILDCVLIAIPVFTLSVGL